MKKVKVGITIGDPAGIGTIITSLAIKQLSGLAEFIVIGKKTNKVELGKIRSLHGRLSIEYLDKALDFIKSRKIDCLVTCPISKEAINMAGYKYSGHTEYFANRTNSDSTVMMLLNKRIRFSLVTRHIPLNMVSKTLSKELIYNNIMTTASSLKRMFDIKKLRFVVCGINPHASDNGLIGFEENKKIKPVIVKLKKSISIINGPISADIAIAGALNKQYDCVIAMYHDQALIPLKVTGLNTGVNITLGLPFVRTSPLHGTAFDLINKPALIKPDSLVAAIKLAVKCTLTQRKA